MPTFKKLIIAGLVTAIAANTGLRNGQGHQGIIDVLDKVRQRISMKEVPPMPKAGATNSPSALTESNDNASANHTRGKEGGAVLTVPLNSELQQDQSKSSGVQSGVSSDPSELKRDQD